MPVEHPSGPRLARPALLTSLHGYRRRWLVPDLLAGVTLLAIAVPEQLATSRLAGMPPITGLYTFIAGTVAFAVLGSAPQLSVGADSTIAPLFAAGIAHIAPAGSAHYMALVSLLAVTVGVLVAVVGLLRLGWIADFLSAPIITGFLAGVTVIIIVHQLPDLFALPSVSGTTVHRVATVIGHLDHANGWSVAIGVGVFAVVLAAERIDPKLPGALLGLLGSTVVVAAAGLRAHGVPVLGTVAHGAPHVGLNDLSLSSLGHVLPIAAVVALVVLSQTAATTRAFADQGGYALNVNRDFVGVGAGSILAGLAGSFAANASPARTGAVASAGGRTQFAGLAAAAGVVLVIPAAGLLKDVPVATLAAILIFVATRLFHVGQLVSVFRFDRWEFGLAIVTLLAVAFVGVEQGIGVAVGLAILDRTRRSARPHSYVLGKIPGTTSWEPMGSPQSPQTVPGVVVVQWLAPVYYANAAVFRAEIHKAIAAASHPPAVLVLDADAITDIDYTGTKTVRALVDELEHSHVTVAVARAVGGTPRNFARSGLLVHIGRDRFFQTVDEAVMALRPGRTDPGRTDPGSTDPGGANARS